MRKLVIDWYDFEAALDSHGMEGRHFVDLETGEILFLQTEYGSWLEEEWSEDVPLEELLKSAELHDWEKDAVRDAARIQENVGNRIVEIPEPESREGYRDMEDFISTVSNKRLREKLEIAIDGKGAFSRFRNVIHQEDEARLSWFDFQQKRRQAQAAGWLQGHGIEVTWSSGKQNS